MKLQSFRKRMSKSQVPVGRGIGAILLSSLLTIAMFPPYDHGWLAWLALVPLLLTLPGRNRATVFLLGLLYGLLVQYGICSWIFQVPGFHWYHGLPLALYLAIYPALWSLAVVYCHQRQPWFKTLFFPALWVSLDYLKNHAGFLSFPWATFDLSQHQAIAVLQIASITGGYGITFLIILANLLISESIRMHRLRPVIGLAIIMLPLLSWGTWESRQPLETPMLKIAAVQPSILRSERKSEQGRKNCRNRLELLTQKAAVQGAELIVWPETAVRYLGQNLQLQTWLKDVASTAGTALLTGASDRFKFQQEEHSSLRSYNSAYFASSSGKISPPYHKRKLVPFGEYLPLQKIITWPQWVVTEFTETIAGNEPVVYMLPDGCRITPIICWENLFPELVRESVLQGSNLIVNISNDNWFGRTAAASQHNLASVLRSVENRIPIIISSNTGPSQIIDHHGRIIASAHGLFSQTMLTGIVNWGDTSHAPVYTRFGDLFAWGCILYSMIVVGSFLFYQKKNMNYL